MILTAPRPVAAAPLPAASAPVGTPNLPQVASVLAGSNAIISQAAPETHAVPLRSQFCPTVKAGQPTPTIGTPLFVSRPIASPSQPNTSVSVVDGGPTPHAGQAVSFSSRLPDSYVEYCYEEFKGPYTEILQFLAAERLLEGLPLDAEGVLRVSVPFCASFIECGILSRYLAQHFLGRPQVRGVHVLGTELTTDPTYLWDKKEIWVAENFPGMKLQMKQADLTNDPLPNGSITIGIHPEVTRGSPWDLIIKNLLRSTPGGLVVLGHFFIEEAKAAIQMISDQGVDCQVFENTYYRGRQMPPSPWMRFFVIARPGRPGPPLPNHPGALPVQGDGGLAMLGQQQGRSAYSQVQRMPFDAGSLAQQGQACAPTLAANQIMMQTQLQPTPTPMTQPPRPMLGMPTPTTQPPTPLVHQQIRSSPPHGSHVYRLA